MILNSCKSPDCPSLAINACFLNCTGCLNVTRMLWMCLNNDNQQAV